MVLSGPGPQRHTALYGGKDLILALVMEAAREIAHSVDHLVSRAQDFKDVSLSVILCTTETSAQRPARTNTGWELLFFNVAALLKCSSYL
jgi:hypothetical protein